VPKTRQEYRNISKDIEIYQNPGAPKNRPIANELHYFLRFMFWGCCLHTVEVTGSNPVSPIPLLSTTCETARPGKTKFAPKFAPISEPGSWPTTP
jgi:hypothetical protein